MALLHTISEAEAGQKLLAWLVRRLAAPRPLLHRWIRTGQVRINGGRRGPFDRLEAGDEVRLPPFAEQPERPETSSGDVPGNAPEAPSGSLPIPPLVARSPDLFVFCKPAGLPTHPGSGHGDSLTTRLHALDRETDFRPTPAHRLDKDTSGLLVVARTYAALRRLQELFRHDCGKEYLTWVQGDWPWDGPQTLHDRLGKRLTAKGEKMRVDPEGKTAALTALCLGRRKGFSLLQVRLHTGRTHQIRAQLAARGFPVAGDRKYGARKGPDKLLLHAARLTLPDAVYEVLPDWPAPWRVDALPPRLRGFPPQDNRPGGLGDSVPPK